MILGLIRQKARFSMFSFYIVEASGKVTERKEHVFLCIDLCISEQDKFHGDLELVLREVKKSKN